MDFPATHQVPIGARRGITLAGCRLKPGFEVVVASRTHTTDQVEDTVELTVANLGGAYFIRSNSVPKDQWLKTFLFCPDRKGFGEP